MASYGFNTYTLIRRILFPASLPTYVIGLRNGLGLGWMFVVAAEFLGLRAPFLLVGAMALLVCSLAWLAYTSVKSTQEIFQGAWTVPKAPQWQNFYKAWNGMPGEPGLGKSRLLAEFVGRLDQPRVKIGSHFLRCAQLFSDVVGKGFCFHAGFG